MVGQLAVVLLALMIISADAFGQLTPAGRPASPSSRPSPSSSRPPSSSGRPTPDAKAKKDGDDKEKKEGEKKEENGESSAKVIKRTEYKPQPDQGPIEVNPDKDGKVKFNFHGASWPVVLNWLARFSQLNLDWQELPGDYLNLRTQHAYTALEARDVINRHLLSRGYTLLEHGELLTVAKVSGIDPGLVPRVEPKELLERMPHEFVKVSLPLDWIIADQAVEQLKPMLSQNGKLSSISAINRLEAMDAVGNLREVYQMLNDEQSNDETEQRLVREFKLKYVRAGVVVDSLYGILGLRKPDSMSGGGGSISSSYSQQIMRQLQQMQQQMQRSSSKSSGGGGVEQTEPRLVLNERENSILAHASPDKMEIIEQTIKALDVESESSSHILQNLDRMKVYRLSTLQPGPLVQILSEVGDLSPTVKIQVDEENNSIILYGSLADHVTLQSLVDKLDGSNRSFEVIPLRRVKAAEVAGTIQYMLGEKEEEDNNSRSRYYGYSYYSSYRQETKKDDPRPFKVEADIERNRLLVWANEIELEEIENLLTKMGEIKPGQSNPATARMIDLHSLDNAQQILERLERSWRQERPNELNIDRVTPPQPESAPAEPKKEARLPGTINRIRNASDKIVSTETSPEDSPSNANALAADRETSTVDRLEQEALRRRFEELANENPAINIRQLPDGRIFLESNDTRALDEMELMISDLVPPAPDYKIFKIKYAWPFGIELLLDDFFASKEDEETMLDWYGNSVTYNKEGPDRLSKKRKLKIISDDDSMTLLVQNATYEQLALIEDLLEIYDRPDSSDPQSVRVTKHFPLKYSKAASIAETVKAVYRDLLSSNDPALQNNKKDEGKSQPVQQGITYTYVRGGGQDDDEGRSQEEPIRFKGLLSVGVDEISNTLVISAARGLMDDLTSLVETLDEAARPDFRVRVAPVSPSINASLLRDRINQSFGIQPAVGVSSTADRGQGQKNGQQQGEKPAQNGQSPNGNGQPNSR